MKNIFILGFLFFIPSVYSQNICISKSVGDISSIQVMSLVSKAKYGSQFNGVSSGIGPSNLLCVTLTDGANPTEANVLLGKSELPTVSVSALDITVNYGLYLINQVTSIVPDPSLIKTVKISIGVHQTTGDVSIVVFEKTNGAYGTPPALTNVISLKEYTVPAAGNSLTEIVNFIN